MSLTNDPLDQFKGEFVTTTQAASVLNISVQRVGDWCRAGQIASRRFGSRYWIPKWAVRNLLRVRMPPVVPNKPYLTLAEAASILHVNPRTLRDRCRKGKIPCRRVGSRYEISYRTLDMLLHEYEERYLVTESEW
jgi:excisionase family DNA binding protein